MVMGMVNQLCAVGGGDGYGDGELVMVVETRKEGGGDGGWEGPKEEGEMV